MMIRKKIHAFMSGIGMLCTKLLYGIFVGLMGVSMILFLCISTLPCFLLEIVFGSDDVFQEFRTITAHFNEQRATDN